MVRETVAQYWECFKQKVLFPLGEEMGPLTSNLEQLIRVWEVLRIEEKVQYVPNWIGRPPKDREAIARAFVAKSFLKLPTTAALIERLAVDSTLRRLCGFARRNDIPSEATFSRAFQEFTDTALGAITHAELVRETYGEKIVGHVSRDATAIEAREKPAKKAPKQNFASRKKGRPKKRFGEGGSGAITT